MKTLTAMRHSRSTERGQALVETALTLPLLLLISVGIFEFGRAFETWQIVTNAAREGARMASLPGADTTLVENRVQTYLSDAKLVNASTTSVVVTPNSKIQLSNGTEVSASTVTVNYPFQFMVLNPIAKLVVKSSTAGQDITMSASAQMRNESPN